MEGLQTEAARSDLDLHRTVKPGTQAGEINKNSGWLSVAWLAHDEVSFHGLPALLDRLPMVASYQVRLGFQSFMDLITEGSFDVHVLPLSLHSKALTSLLSQKNSKAIFTLSVSERPSLDELAPDHHPDAWLLQQQITYPILFKKFKLISSEFGASREIPSRPVETIRRLPHRSRVKVTDREHSVLQLLSQGKSNQQIAKALGISIHGVKRHISNLLLKFDCSNRTEIALLVTRSEILEFFPASC